MNLRATIARHLGLVLIAAACALTLALLSPAAVAQDVGRWEFGPFAGGVGGARLFRDANLDIGLGRHYSYGARLSYDVTKLLSLEVAYSRSNVPIILTTPSTHTRFGPTTSVEIDSYELDATHSWGTGRVRGIFGVGAGAVTLDPFVHGAARSTQFAANVFLGGKFFLTDRLALRLDGRYRVRAVSSRSAGVICGDNGCYGTNMPAISLGELTGGFSYRFGNTFSYEIDKREPKSKTALEAAPPKRFFNAATELVLLEVVPWAFSRYVTHEDFAYISGDTIEQNLETGFAYDRDAFEINQSSHPLHGSMFFNAARSNGYGFWPSAAFTLTGSFLWECCMENTTPSVNDIVNTTLGGMSRGEIAHRLGIMIRDNTAHGFKRFLREAVAAVIDPIGSVTRLMNGEMARVYPNPEERFPSGFNVTTELGYQRISGSPKPDEAMLSLEAVYGDPFRGEYRRPFDSIWAAADFTQQRIARIEGRGILRGWELSDPSARTRSIFGFYLEYQYFNSEAQVFGAQVVSAGLSTRTNLPKGFALGIETVATGFPMAGVRTTDFANPETGRNYDYGPGIGARGAIGLYRNGWSIATASYGIAWTRTADGLSDTNRVQFLRTALRLPIVKHFGVGLGYSWYARQTNYPGFHEPQRTQGEYRAFASWSLR